MKQTTKDKANKEEYELNIFEDYEELERQTGKTEDSWKNIPNRLNSMHYRKDEVTAHAYVRNCREIGWKHADRRLVESSYDNACTMRRENLQRYCKLYNERNKFQSLDELRATSLYLNHCHNGIHGYHGTDTTEKYRLVHLKDEKPYAYYGIEVEVTFDDTMVDGYTGDRYDEDGDYYEEGDYDSDGNYIPETYDFDIYEIAREFMRRAKGIFVAEEDGSLYRGYSFECVSVAMSYRAWHSERVKEILEDAFGYLKEQGALVDQPRENGLHIHISRKFFSGDRSENGTENAEREMNWIFQKYQDEIEQIGGRKFNGWCQTEKMNLMTCWPSIDAGRFSKDKLKLDYGNHHRAFIKSNSGETYEARVFHSTLDYKKILAYIEFMRDISHGARDNVMAGKTFKQITTIKDSPYLQGLIKEIRAEQKKNKQKMLCLTRKNTETLTFKKEN